MPVQICVVRHGPRLDEVDSSAWRKIKNDKNRHNPPLTQDGWAQAQLAGRRIRDTIGHERSRAGTVYASPTSRTLSTAAAIAEEFGVATIVPAYGLNCCAAAQSYGVQSSGFSENPPGHTLGLTVSLAPGLPHGDPKVIDARQRRSGSFVTAVKELAAEHVTGDLIVLVTHREGIYELMHHAGARHGRVGYCDSSFYLYDEKTGKIKAETPSPPDPLPQPAGGLSWERKQSLCSALIGKAAGVRRTLMAECSPSAEAIKAEPSSLNDLLLQGSGTVVVRRRSGGSTALWRTPGVRGVWVAGGNMMNGELVNLLSCPQSSENGEGDFVLVRNGCGVEGWTKIKHLHLPSS